MYPRFVLGTPDLKKVALGDSIWPLQERKMAVQGTPAKSSYYYSPAIAANTTVIELAIIITAVARRR
jgi:hypothetical protein